LKKLDQNWWHIRDKPVLTSKFSFNHPFRSCSRNVRQVMDIITNETRLQAPLARNFVRLKVRKKSNGEELPFLEEDRKICINLGSLEDWPLYHTHNPMDPKLRHVKIEIDFDLLNQNFKSKKLDLFKNRFYTSAFSIDQIVQPEFYISLPRGTKLNKKSSILLLLLNFNENTSLEESVDSIGLEKLGIINNKTAYQIRFEKPSIDIEEKTRRYSYLVNFEDFERIKMINELINGSSENNEEIYFGYEVNYDRKLLFIIWILNLVISTVAILRILRVFHGESSEIGFLSYLIILLSLITLNIKLYEDEYLIPTNLITYFSMAVLIFGMIIEVINI
jgi:hypothetical protein